MCASLGEEFEVRTIAVNGGDAETCKGRTMLVVSCFRNCTELKS